MIIRKLRLQRSWSQEQLSQMSGLSNRTIQRIEKGEKASHESLKSLAAVFEIDVILLSDPSKENGDITMEEENAMLYVENMRIFYLHTLTFIIVLPGLFLLNWLLTPGFMWSLLVLGGWGIGVAIHALWTFDVLSFLGTDWEKKAIEKRLGRKL